jgi:hypothetical protein
MSRYQLILDAIKVAGYHGDERTAMRLFVESPVSFQAYREAYRKGRIAKLAGVPCTCPDCREKTPRPPTVRAQGSEAHP